jgi:hypothetical protein
MISITDFSWLANTYGYESRGGEGGKSNLPPSLMQAYDKFNFPALESMLKSHLHHERVRLPTHPIIGDVIGWGKHPCLLGSFATSPLASSRSFDKASFHPFTSLT